MNEEVCALVDGCDTFDPHSAEAAGVELKQLLWVRCRNIEQSLRATDLLIQGGGFGLIALDLSDVPPETVRYVPLNAWFRFRRAVEDTQTILVVLEQEPHAKTCASLVLKLGAEPAIWSETLETTNPNFSRHPLACLLDGFEVHAEVLRSRLQSMNGTFFQESFTPAGGRKNRPGIFETKTPWSAFGGLPAEPQRPNRNRDDH
jgi:hypothetical protein